MARALYIHWPFCRAKCPYCDFNSHVRDTVDIAQWQAALLADMRHEAATSEPEPLTSIFFGGGTPSLMPPALVAALLAEAEHLWGFAAGIEITLEGNPSSVEAASYADLASAGINRASLGLQSLDNEALQFLGRLHNAEEGLAALNVAQMHFSRVSFDLIYALPGQTSAAWESELTRAIALGTGHLSLYQLTIEPGTRFETDVRRGTFLPMGDDNAAELFALTRSITQTHGLPAYEISNHARPTQESRHNLAYWRYDDYIGIGPGAHGRRGGYATTRHKKPENWLPAVEGRGSGMQEERLLAPTEMAMEALLMGLRLAEGVNLANIAARCGVAKADLLDPMGLVRVADFVWSDGDTIGVREEGMPVLDAILGELVAPGLVAA